MNRKPDLNGAQPDLKIGPPSHMPGGWRLVALCAALAAVPDIDLLHIPIHRTVTHSVTAALAVTIVAAAVTGWVTARIQWTIAIACGAAYGSHIVMDWLGADASRPYGIQALWPFTDRWYMAPWSVFPGTERRSPLSARSMWINFKAAVAEIGIMGSVALLAWRTRAARKRQAAPGGRTD
jgi:inner membrane protein